MFDHSDSRSYADSVHPLTLPIYRFLIATIILAMFLFAVAASEVVAFGGVGVTAFDAMRLLIAGGPPVSLLNAEVIAIVASAIALPAIHATFWKHRPACAAVTAAITGLLPLGILFVLEGCKGAAVWASMLLLGPVLTVGMFVGLDGETWSEGMLAIAAASLWSILWLCSALCDWTARPCAMLHNLPRPNKNSAEIEEV